MELEKRSSDLYRIKQKPDETIRAFLTRFNNEKVSIPRCDVGTTVEAFREGLPLDSDFYDVQTMNPCHTFEDVQAKALGYIRLKEDKSFKAETINSVAGYEMSSRKSAYHRRSSSRPSPYTRPDKLEVNYAHDQRGHTTEKYLGLRKQVAYLLKKGYLKDLMSSKKKDNNGSRNDQERTKRELPPAPPIYEVKFINRVSEICGLTSSAANKIARGISNLHHDGLVITMQIGTARVPRILVDSGSSVNLIMLDVLKAMKIDEDQIIKKSNVLVGFSGETKNTLGEIYLPTYVEGLSPYERFRVLDCLSSYNAILAGLGPIIDPFPQPTTTVSKFQQNGE
ncbi:uncharacterized protein LOC141630213 [Silene latifolia]|uniref:uncharacterized protein LOC141630213 n=1 Tax=Silene latifolia TaxID=37657 RepID=UPI003D76B31F